MVVELLVLHLGPSVQKLASAAVRQKRLYSVPGTVQRKAEVAYPVLYSVLDCLSHLVMRKLNIFSATCNALKVWPQTARLSDSSQHHWQYIRSSHCRDLLHCWIFQLKPVVKGHLMGCRPDLSRSLHCSLYRSNHLILGEMLVVHGCLANMVNRYPEFGISKCLTIHCHLL
jgi:hypothetical protein